MIAKPYKSKFMKFFTLMFFVLIVNVSCKTKTNYNKEAYAEIMDGSIPLFAKEEKGKVYPSSVVRFSDKLYVNEKNQTKLERMSKVKVIKNISTLRKSGFFKTYENLNDSEIFERIHLERKAEYSRIFEKEYDPGMELDEFELACLDITKVLFIDLEADVCEENKVYTQVIKSFATLTNNVFDPKKIQENWIGKTGPIEIEFEIENVKTKFSPEYKDDWLDEVVFKVCKEKIEEKNIRLVNCLGDNEYGFGQAISIMRLTEEEQRILEDSFSWKFVE